MLSRATVDRDGEEDIYYLARSGFRLHGGRVVLANRPGGGLGVTITIPQ